MILHVRVRLRGLMSSKLANRQVTGFRTGELNALLFGMLGRLN